MVPGPARLRLLAANHDGQSRFLRSHVTSGDGRIDTEDALLLSSLGDFNGQRRFAGRHIHQNITRLASSQRAGCPQDRLRARRMEIQQC